MMNRAEEEIESVFARIGEVQQVSLDLEMLTGHVNYIIIYNNYSYSCIYTSTFKGVPCMVPFQGVNSPFFLGFKGTQPL